MSLYYRDYLWKNGLPYGLHPCDEKKGDLYKVLSDPYHRVVFIEKYRDGQFNTLVYDSRLLNFRKLSPQTQTAWQRTVTTENDSLIVSEIRNEDDQFIIKETMHFEGNLCRRCTLTSPQGIFLGEHRMSYTYLGDKDNSVYLYDSNEHCIMYKEYVFNEEELQFSDLIKECWEPSATSLPAHQ